MKNFYITMLLALLGQFVIAQNTLSGTIITNDTQEPLEQVSISRN